MGAQENKQTAREAYDAFGRGDAEGAMRNIDDSVEWVARGDNALTGTYNGKQEVGAVGEACKQGVPQRAARFHRRGRQSDCPDHGHA